MLNKKLKGQYENVMILDPVANHVIGDEIKFYTNTPDRIHVATGYRRVVIGDRGPYVEFAHDHVFQVLHTPEDQKWRAEGDWPMKVFYFEFRTADGVMVYKQNRTVKYADYQIGMFYVSPWDLTTEEYPILAAGEKPEHHL